MPKIIQDVRETALREAKVQMLRDGMEALTMRSVASACGIAVGTLYNYFPSKDMLIASAMLEDWLQCLQTMKRNVDAAGTVRQGLEAVYDQIIAFSDIYAKEWTRYQMQTETIAFLGKRHSQLIRQLSDVICSLVGRLTGTVPDIFCRAAAELLLQQTSQAGRDGFAEIFPALEKLLA